jgi:hypothetical protein
MVITSLIYDTVGKSLTQGKVDWSCQHGGATARSKNAMVTLAPGLMTANGSVIMSEISYAYSSPTTKFVPTSTTFTSTFYTRPRRSASVTAPACP